MKATMKHWTTTRLALLLGVLTFIADPDSSVAAPCDGVPYCAPQVMAPVRYGWLDTYNWAYYCTGDHPYYWNNDQVLGFGNNFSFTNHHCFSVIEDPFEEGDPTKMDATITNWCLDDASITVTLGCSQQPQEGPSCPNNNTTIGHDPGCPMQGPIQNHCSSTNPPVCMQTWTEQCSNGPAYCTASVLNEWCIVCQ